MLQESIKIENLMNFEINPMGLSIQCTIVCTSQNLEQLFLIVMTLHKMQQSKYINWLEPKVVTNIQQLIGIAQFSCK